MGKFTVVKVGTDTSGRGIFLTRYMQAWLAAVRGSESVAPFADKIVVTQGAFMLRAGGGADASAGYHDKAACIDFRTWNLTADELETFIRACRRRGGAAWRRDAAHGGMEEHCHVTLGGDQPMTPGAKDSWGQYVAGRNGLTGSAPGSDYEWRPIPLVTSFQPTPTEDDMQDADFDRIAKMLDFRIDKVLNQLSKARQRDAALDATLAGIVDQLTELSNGAKDDATITQVRNIRDRLLKQIETLRQEPPA